MAEFLTGNPRCPICAGHHPVKAPCFFSTNWIPLEKTPMADKGSEELTLHYLRRAEAAEAEVDRLKGVLGAVNGYMINACICMAAGGTKARATDILNQAVDIAHSALEAKP